VLGMIHTGYVNRLRRKWSEKAVVDWNTVIV
jgi:hypothetical protein